LSEKECVCWYWFGCDRKRPCEKESERVEILVWTRGYLHGVVLIGVENVLRHVARAESKIPIFAGK